MRWLAQAETVLVGNSDQCQRITKKILPPARCRASCPAQRKVAVLPEAIAAGCGFRDVGRFAPEVDGDISDPGDQLAAVVSAI